MKAIPYYLMFAAGYYLVLDYFEVKTSIIIGVVAMAVMAIAIVRINKK